MQRDLEGGWSADGAFRTDPSKTVLFPFSIPAVAKVDIDVEIRLIASTFGQIGILNLK